MSRKKWTPQTEVNETVLQVREKRKWQIALRRYVLEKNKCFSYAPYFGLDNDKFREWIELQFDAELNWDNFSSRWQFEHVLPVAYFDFSKEEELKLCWNFINIRVEKVNIGGASAKKIDILAAKKHFEWLYRQTGYLVCAAMLDKISRLESLQAVSDEKLAGFILANRDYLDTVKTFGAADFERLNTGTELKTLLSEKEFLKKFGG